MTTQARTRSGRADLHCREQTACSSAGIQPTLRASPNSPAEPLPPNLDAIRGLACILLVAYHVVGGSAEHGLRLHDEHGARLVMEWLGDIRMPVFAALSGYLFAARPPSATSYRRFMTGKLRRLGIPLLTATTIFMLLRWGVYGIVPHPSAFVTGYQHLWFLQASLLLFATFGLWAAYSRQSWSALLAVVPLAGLATDLLPWVTLLSMSGAIELAPFFAFGTIARRHRSAVMSRQAIAAALTVVVAVMTLSAAHLLGAAGVVSRSGLLVALCGCGWFALFIRFVPPARWLSIFGVYSYAIFLWHPLFGAAARMLAKDSGITAYAPLAVVSFMAALGAPILLHKLAERRRTTALLLLGLARPTGVRP